MFCLPIKIRPNSSSSFVVKLRSKTLLGFHLNSKKIVRSEETKYFSAASKQFLCCFESIVEAKHLTQSQYTNKLKHRLYTVSYRQPAKIEFLNMSGNKFVSGAGGLGFKSRAGQIGHSVANGSPPLRYFFEKSCVADTHTDVEKGPFNSLHAAA